MTDTISAESVRVANALIAQIEETEGGLLTDEQKQTFRSLREVTDAEEKSTRTMKVMDGLIADAKVALESGAGFREQAESLTGQFSPEAQQEIRNSVSEFEGRLRSDAQTELRSLTVVKKTTGAARGRLRI